MKFQVSGLITDLRGKLGGSVASRNRVGSFLRTYVIPRNTFTDYRQTTRLRFGAIASRWRGLDNTTKLTWATKAPQFTFYDSLGNAFHPTAWQLYLYINMNIYPATTNFIDTAPDYALLTNAGASYNDYNISGHSCVCEFFSPSNSNEWLKISVSKFYPQSEDLTKVPVQFIKVYDPTDESTLSIYNEINEINNRTGIATERFYLKCYKVNVTTGQVSPMQSTVMICQA